MTLAKSIPAPSHLPDDAPPGAGFCRLPGGGYRAPEKRDRDYDPADVKQAAPEFYMGGMTVGPTPPVPSLVPTLDDLANPGQAEAHGPFRSAYAAVPPELRVDLAAGQAVTVARSPDVGSGVTVNVIDVAAREWATHRLRLTPAQARKLRAALDLVL